MILPRLSSNGIKGSCREFRVEYTNLLNLATYLIHVKCKAQMSSIIRNLATLVMNYPPTEVAILFQLVQARF